MKTVMKKMLSLMLVAVMLVGVMPFQASAASNPYYRVILSSDNSPVDTVGMELGVSYNIADCIPSGYVYDFGQHQYSNGDIGSLSDPFQGSEGDVIIIAVKAAPAHEHSYTGVVTTQPTCTAEGVKTFTCSCGDSYTNPVAVVEHTEAIDAYVAPTCTETGLTEGKHCSACGTVLTTQTVIPALEHNYVNGECANCGLCYECKADPCTCTKTTYQVNISLSKDGIEKAFTRNYKEGSEITLDAALVNEVAFGDATVEWIVNGSHVADGSTVTVNGPMTISCSITNKETKVEYIDLDPNGGYLPSYVSDEYPVVIGQPYGNLPEPTREGYTFAYWYYEDKNDNEVRVYNTTIVKNFNDLEAKWIVNGVKVVFQRYDMIESWVDVEEHNVPAYSVLTVEDGTFPSDRRISLVYDIDGFEIEGWEIAGTGEEFEEDETEVTHNIVVRPVYEGYVTLKAQEPVTGASWKTHKAKVVIGKVIGELTNPGSRSNYIFDGWLASNGSSLICDRFCNSKLKYYPHEMGTTFYAKWEGGITVNLHIHTNGNTTTATKIVPYYVAPAEGVFDMKVIDMYSIFSDYYKYDDDCDKIYGWYDSEEWKNYCANRASHPATSYTDIQENGQFDFHIMLINKGDNSSSSSSSGVADSSNPKTGDMIFAPAMVLGASVAVLAALFFLNKKRAF